MSANLYDLFTSRLPADPRTTFLETGDGAKLSYGDIEASAGRMTRLLGDLGVKPGDRVAAQVDKSPQAVLLYLACLKAGAVYLPLNPAYTADEIGYFLGDAEPRVLVCGPGVAAALTAAAEAAGVGHVLTLGADGSGSLSEQSAGLEPRAGAVERETDDLAAILYTSGTTGRPKGAMITHANLASNALALHRIWGWRDGDVLLHALPIFHVHGLFVALHCALLNASTVLFLARFEADAVIEVLPRSTVMMGVPTFYTRLAGHPGLTPELCANMRLFISGSAPLGAETFRAFEERSGHRILERYGMTETGMIASNPLNGERLPSTVGFPLPGVRVRLAGEDGGIGILEITGPNVFKGYWGKEENTNEDFSPDGWFITGDLAAIGGDGRVSIAGRGKDMIISGGLNVYPKEIENQIDGLDGVRESAVIGIHHPDLGEAVTAVVVADAMGAISERSVCQGLDGKLARFKIPKRVFFIDELPRNAMGKVQKAQLRERFADTFGE
ncbi:MAG: AMP-binding protein [Rhodospirillales bacterium]